MPGVAGQRGNGSQVNDLDAWSRASPSLKTVTDGLDIGWSGRPARSRKDAPPSLERGEFDSATLAVVVDDHVSVRSEIR